MKECAEGAEGGVEGEYKRKLEGRLKQNNAKAVWAGMKHITGFKTKQQAVGGSLDTR